MRRSIGATRSAALDPLRLIGPDASDNLGFGGGEMARIRMSSKTYRTAAFSAALLVAAGCSSHAKRIGRRPPASYEVVGSGRGSGCGVVLFGILPVQVNDRLERAYSEALGGRDRQLVDGKVRESWYVIPFVGYLLCTDVEGTVARW